MVETVFQIPNDFWKLDVVASPHNDERYWLRRNSQLSKVVRDEESELDCVAPALPIIFTMLNPSDARGEGIGDPTQRKCDGFARRVAAPWYGIINLFARSTPYPTDLFLFGEKGAIGRHNEEIRTRVFNLAKVGAIRIVCAWGSPSKFTIGERVYFDRAVKRFTDHAEALQIPLYALAEGQGGYPRHPLMLGYEGASLKLWIPL